MSTFEKPPLAQPESAAPQLPEIDRELQERLESKFSKPIEEFSLAELPGESLRLMEAAEASDSLEDSEALWWFFRSAEATFAQELAEHHTSEFPGELEELAYVYDKVTNAPEEDTTATIVRHDIETWWEAHGRGTDLTSYSSSITSAA